MHGLRPSGSSQSLFSQYSVGTSFDPVRYEQKLTRIRQMSAEADLVAQDMMKQAAARQALARRRPATSILYTRSPSKAASAKLPNFIPAPRFIGARKGYTYKGGPGGMGYYLDQAKGTRPVEDARAPVPLPPPVEPVKKKKTHDEEFRDRQELAQIVSMAESGLNSRFTDMYKAFQYVDLDRSGRLSKKEIARALDLWNVPMDDHKLDLLLERCDADGDGGISYEEFVDVLARETVAPAAMGKRGMQSKEAMGVDSQEMLAKQLGHNNFKEKFNPTING
jgi:hypothetical protein